MHGWIYMQNPPNSERTVSESRWITISDPEPSVSSHSLGGSGMRDGPLPSLSDQDDPIANWLCSLL
jgi:hypothetical protein